jgi:hypothetical protein
MTTPPNQPTRSAARRFTRRAFLVAGLGGLAAPALAAGYARYCEPFWPEWVRVPLDLPRLGDELRGYRIIQLSDLHASDIVPADYLRGQCELVAAQRPDLVVLTGDYISYGAKKWIDVAADCVARLKARDGVLAVLGNHDYHCRRPGMLAVFKQGERIAGRLCDALAAAGARVLRNERWVLHRGAARLQFVGLDDLWAGEYDGAAAFADVTPDAPCIALSHNPDTIDDLRRRPCDWILSGHTHGGQVRLPLVGAPLLPVDHRELDAGHFRVGRQSIYVNRGLGYIRKVRFGCRPEITEFALTPA